MRALNIAGDALDERVESRRILAEAPVFRGLGDALDTLAARAKVSTFHAGTTIISQHTVAPFLCVVVRGRVSIYSESKEGRTALRELGPRSAFGRGPLTDAQEPVSFGALTDVQALTFSRAALGEVLRDVVGLRQQLETRLSLYRRTRQLIALLQETRVFRHIGGSLMQALLLESTLLYKGRDSVIFDAGDPGDSYYLIVSGEVTIVSERNADGECDTLSVLRAGDGFGEMALLSGGIRSAGAVATEDCELLRIGKPEFDALCQQSSGFKREVLNLSHSRKTANERLLSALPLHVLINRSRCHTPSLASLVSRRLGEVHDERVLCCRVGEAPVDRAGADEHLSVQVPASAVDTLAAVLESEVEKQRPDRVIVYAEPASAELEQKLLPLSAQITFVAPDYGVALPVVVSGVKQVRHVVAHDPRRDQGPIARGVARIDVGSELDAVGAQWGALSEAARAGIDRLSRVISGRSVGLALSGGGAWGFAHHVLIRGMHDRGIVPDFITGVSFGSISGAFYASAGLDGLRLLEDSARWLQEIVRFCIVHSWPLGRFIQQKLRHERLEELPTPFFPIAADILDGSERIFRQGPIGDGVRASGAFPGMFCPAILGGSRYVDGAVVNNVPASILPEEGADFVVASDVMQGPPKIERRKKGPVRRLVTELSLPTRIRDTVRALSVLLRTSCDRQAAAAHVTVHPKIPEVDVTEMARVKDVLKCAEDQIGPSLEKLEKQYKLFCL